MKNIFFLAFLFLKTLAFAQSQPSWQDSFYTDDSKYFFELTTNGFQQRLRVHKDTCQQIKAFDVIFKSSATEKSYPFKFMNKSEYSRWPEVYGTQYEDYCWYQVKVSGLHLNRPAQNQYVIRIYPRHDDQIYYFQGYDQSILPKERLTTAPIKTWIQLGALGASLVKGGGIFFKIWEPIVQRVDLITNNSKEPYMLIPDEALKEQRCHVIYLPDAEAGDTYQYKFVKNNSYEILENGNDNLFTAIKVDPMALNIDYEAKGGKYNAYINPKAIITPPTNYIWKNDLKINQLKKLESENWLIYQLWPLTFNPPFENGKIKQGTFKTIKEKVNFLSDLGINAVEFLPVNETRFHASWGYALDSLLLVEKNYGTRTELQDLVDNLHDKKIRVIFDIVINHVNNHLIRDPLCPLVHSSKFFDGDTGWGPSPDFKKVMVQKWITDSLLLLKRDFHVDAFRWDMIEYVYRKGQKEYLFLQNLLEILRMDTSRFENMAEQLPDNVWATYPRENNGLGFQSQWNDKFKNFFENEFDHYRETQRNIDISPLLGALNGFSDQRYGSDEYFFGPPSRTVNYLGSHDFVGNKNPILRIVSNYESYEWESFNHFFRVNPLEENNPQTFKMIHNHFTHAVARVAYGVLFTKPGPILFFQGEELGNDLNIENEWSYLAATEGNSFPSQNVDLNRYLNSHKMPWDFYLPNQDGKLFFLSDEERNLFHGHYSFFKEMLKFRGNYPEINLENAKNVQISHNGTVVSYQITANEKKFFIVANFGYDQSDFWITFPGQGHLWWREIINTSHPKFGGKSGKYLNVISNLGGRPNNIRLKGPSLSIFEEETRAQISKDLYLRGTHNNWEATPEHILQQASDKGHIYITQVEIEEDTILEFKIADSTWEIELGRSDNNQDDLINSNNNLIKGSLTYVPEQKNVRIALKKGVYKFLFNLETFTVSLTFLRKLLKNKKDLFYDSLSFCSQSCFQSLVDMESRDISTLFCN